MPLTCHRALFFLPVPFPALPEKRAPECKLRVPLLMKITKSEKYKRRQFFATYCFIEIVLICLEELPFQCSLKAPHHGNTTTVQRPFKRPNSVLVSGEVAEMQTQ